MNKFNEINKFSMESPPSVLRHRRLYHENIAAGKKKAQKNKCYINNEENKKHSFSASSLLSLSKSNEP
jgi:hypothetical protein